MELAEAVAAAVATVGGSDITASSIREYELQEGIGRMLVQPLMFLPERCGRSYTLPACLTRRCRRL